MENYSDPFERHRKPHHIRRGLITLGTAATSGFLTANLLVAGCDNEDHSMPEEEPAVDFAAIYDFDEIP